MFKMKRKKNENGEEMENAYDVFMRNYKTVPGFKAVSKLFGYGIFIFIILVLLASTSNNESVATPPASEEKITTTTKPTTQKVVYIDILNELKTIGKKVNIEATDIVNNQLYIIEGETNENGFAGYIESTAGTKKFIIKENNIYEKVLEQETMNNELLSGLDKDFIVPSNFIDILTKETTLKTYDGDTTIYIYKITKENVEYEIKNFVKSEKCYKIEINSASYKYIMTYK